MLTDRRAPRLAPHERIAPHITRRGRFAGRDPLEQGRLPRLLEILGVALWAGLAGYAFWRAYREEQEQEAT